MFDPVQINKLYTFIKSKANGRSTKHMSQKRTANVIENKVGFALVLGSLVFLAFFFSLSLWLCWCCPACNASCCTQVALSVATATQPLISFASHSSCCSCFCPFSLFALDSFSFSEKAKRRMKIAFNWAHLLFELTHGENSISLAWRSNCTLEAGGVLQQTHVAH